MGWTVTAWRRLKAWVEGYWEDGTLEAYQAEMQRQIDERKLELERRLRAAASPQTSAASCAMAKYTQLSR